jgi:hypothetical protein
MKKYYLHNGTESSGPFAIEELKAKNITTKTPVWFEGMEKWKTAGELPELNSVFAVIPPPFKTTITPPPTEKEETKKVAHKILGLSKSTFFIIIGALIVLVGVSVLNTIQEDRSRELQLKNHKTEIENYQLEIKQKEAEDEKVQAAIQAQIDAQRADQEKKQSDSTRLSEIDKIVAQSQSRLDLAKKDLTSASGFKLLRTAAEKKEQMSLLQNTIDSIKNEMSQLKKESDEIKLEMEKIPK